MTEELKAKAQAEAHSRGMSVSELICGLLSRLGDGPVESRSVNTKSRVVTVQKCGPKDLKHTPQCKKWKSAKDREFGTCGCLTVQ